MNISSHITRGYVWQENKNTVVIQRRFVQLHAQFNKKGFEGSLLKNARKAVDGFQSFSNTMGHRSINGPCVWLCCYVSATSEY